MAQLSEKSKIQLDIKTLIGIVLGIITVAGVWFDLTAKISAIESSIMRIEYNQGLNDEFRIKWPRGEMGALPDDAKQDLRIEYLQRDVEKLQNIIEEIEKKNHTNVLFKDEQNQSFLALRCDQAYDKFNEDFNSGSKWKGGNHSQRKDVVGSRVFSGCFDSGPTTTDQVHCLGRAFRGR